MGISGNQIVFLNGQSLEWGNIRAGVPQCSALGPLLRVFQIVFRGGGNSQNSF